MRAPARILVGRLALFIFVIGLTLPNFASSHLLAEADPDCGAFPTADHARPGFETVKTSAQHCALCHWLRSLRETAPPAVAGPAAALVVAERVTIGRIDPAGHCPQLDSPTRAPPTASAV
jgi:hypothetical protein